MSTLLSIFQNSFVYIFACVILLGILIFVHELGHFLVARWCGVRVEVFSLGFGKKIWQRVRGDTTYAISMIPLGGYVKMFGEQPGETISPDLHSVSFTHKTVWQRIAIVLAGPLMNLFFAMVVFAAVAMIGTDVRGPFLGDVPENSQAYNAGFRSGDRIVAVNGQPIEVYEDINKQLNESIGRTATLGVARGTETLSLSAEVSRRPNPNPLSTSDYIGEIDGLSPLSKGAVVGVVAESPLWHAGLRAGDRVMAINGTPIKYFRDIESAVATAEGSLSVDIERANASGETEKLTATVPAQKNLAAVGIEAPDVYLARVMDGSPAQAAGLQEGDRLITVGGKTITRWEDVLETIKGYNGQGGIEIQYRREAETRTTKVEPQVTTQMTAFGAEDKRYTVGISAMIDIALPDSVTQRTLNPVAALARGVQQSWDYSVITVLSFVRLFQAKISHKTVGGLLSIGQAAGETMKMGITKFMLMMGIISINLFILNLLPVPVLDGGHLVFYTIEAIKGSPLSLKKIEFAQQIGLVLLMGLMVFALFNDVTRLIFDRM